MSFDHCLFSFFLLNQRKSPEKPPKWLWFNAVFPPNCTKSDPNYRSNCLFQISLVGLVFFTSTTIMHRMWKKTHPQQSNNDRTIDVFFPPNAEQTLAVFISIHKITNTDFVGVYNRVMVVVFCFFFKKERNERVWTLDSEREKESLHITLLLLSLCTGHFFFPVLLIN